MNRIEQTTIDKIRRLSPDLQQQILTFVEFIEFKSSITQLSKDVEIGAKRQGFGLWKGDIIIHDNFDEPLSDFEAYM